MTTPIKIPELGESVTEAAILEWHKSEGDHVEKDEPLVELESDKATMDLPAPASGTLTQITKQAGDSVQVGDEIAQIGDEQEQPEDAEAKAENGEARKQQPETEAEASEDDETSEAGPKADSDQEKQKHKKPKEQERNKAQKEPKQKQAKEEDRPEDAEAQEPEAPAEAKHKPSKTQKKDREAEEQDQAPESKDVSITPEARSLLQKAGIDVKRIEPSGEDGRILKKDVIRFVLDHPEEFEGDLDAEAEEAEAPEEPEPATGQAEPREAPTTDGERRVAMSAFRKTVAARLVQAQRQSVPTTTVNEADLSAVQALRERCGEAFADEHGVKLGLMSFFVRAVSEALRQFPELNARIEDEQIVYPAHQNIGIAMDTERGLMVPTLRAAESMSFADIESAIDEFKRRAQNRKIEPRDLEDGTFTITNGGVFGSLLSTPILNPPQSGVLGMHAIEQRPVALDDGRVAVRPMMYLALTYDHRLVDGREAVSFLRHVVEQIEDPGRMLLGA